MPQQVPTAAQIVAWTFHATRPHRAPSRPIRRGVSAIYELSMLRRAQRRRPLRGGGARGSPVTARAEAAVPGVHPVVAPRPQAARRRRRAPLRRHAAQPVP